jgi:MFS family permease
MGPVFANSIGLAEFGVASFMSAVILGGMAAQWPIGSLSDCIDRRKVIIATAALKAMPDEVIA